LFAKEVNNNDNLTNDRGNYKPFKNWAVQKKKFGHY